MAERQAVTIDDIETAKAVVLALGATRLPGEGENWRGLRAIRRANRSACWPVH